MGRIVADAIKAVDARRRGDLKTTPEHTGFGHALDGIREELGAKSPILEVGDDRAILKLDRASLVDAIEVELDRPAGKRKMAERIADGISDLVSVHALELDRGGPSSEELEGAVDVDGSEELDEDPAAKPTARGTIGRFDSAVEAPGGGGDGES